MHYFNAESDRRNVLDNECYNFYQSHRARSEQLRVLLRLLVVLFGHRQERQLLVEDPDQELSEWVVQSFGSSEATGDDA